MTDLLQILAQAQRGDPEASAQLLPLVYNELRQLARQKLAHERPGQTLDATALVHEAYLRLLPRGERDAADGPAWDNRRHFFAAAAEAMRRILIEKARHKARIRHGGGLRRLELNEAASLPEAVPPVDLIALDEALSRLADLAPVKAELVKLRYFAGLTMPEVASAMGISLATAERYWTFARSWLYAELSHDDGDADTRPAGHDP